MDKPYSCDGSKEKPNYKVLLCKDKARSFAFFRVPVSIVRNQLKDKPSYKEKNKP